MEAFGLMTTFRIGGDATRVTFIDSVEVLKTEARKIAESKTPFFILGGGSNTLISDTGFKGVVLKMGIKGIRRISEDADAVLVEVGAGEEWDTFVKWSVCHMLWGVENLSAIPGTVGASPVQNIGAYGVEAKDTIHSVKVFDLVSFSERTLSNVECLFGYRDSIFKKKENKQLVVISVVFKLNKKANPQIDYKDVLEYFVRKGITDPHINNVREAITAIRSAKFPDLNKEGTAGSFWKNPFISKGEYERLASLYPGLPSFPNDEHTVKIPLAWILDKVCNFKGLTHKGARLFEKQPLVLIASRGTPTSDVLALVSEVEREVYKKTNILIEREVEYVGL